MPQFRKDPVTGRWVIVDREHPKLEFNVGTSPKSSKTCPFCPGHENMTPPAIVAYAKKGTPKGSDWQVRVVPNKFPALSIEENPEKSAIGVYDRLGGFGAHEVIIENPNHDREIADMSEEEVEWILRAYVDRCQDLRKDPRFKYILIFKNYGPDAGASMEHPHSQLIALPIVPSRVKGELKGAQAHMDHTERCLFCDMLRQENAEKKLTVYSNEHFTVLAPFASRFPFETWLLPKNHEASFDGLPETSLKAMAVALKTVLSKIKHSLKDPSYNFMIHTLPLETKSSDSFHWHMEIIPHLTQVAGFELGTGFYLNPTPPEAAAERLRMSP